MTSEKTKKLQTTLGELEKYRCKDRDLLPEIIPDSSPIKHFFCGKNVFLTGGTGFLGQLYVEKLLRIGVKNIYVLARPKRGKPSKDRLAEVYSGPVFEKLNKQDPDYMNRIQVIDGNMIELNLAISEDMQNLIIENVNIILHTAADVRFDETLQHLLLVNVRGTREVLRLAEKIKNLELFLHISTAYSHCPLKHIEEKFYRPPIDPHKMILIAEKMTGTAQAEFEIVTNRLIEPWPNTYTFTKALSEELVRQYSEKFLIAVIRPTIVIPTFEDPISGWINNIYGLTGVLISTGLGFQRILPYKADCIGDIVCADFVINSTLAVGWITHRDQPKMLDNSETNETRPEAKIYHVSSYQDRPANFGDIARLIEEAFFKIPSEKTLWVPCVNTTDYAILEFLYIIFFHIVPAIFFDLLFKIMGRKLRLMPMYRKSQKFIYANTYFMTREWIFENSQMKSVCDSMTTDDKIYFPSDIRKYNFQDYSIVYYLGLRQYIIKEHTFDLKRAKTKVTIVKYIHKLVLCGYYGIIGTIVYFLLNSFGIITYLYSLYELLVK